jgi:hypothetical protein
VALKANRLSQVDNAFSRKSNLAMHRPGVHPLNAFGIGWTDWWIQELPYRASPPQGISFAKARAPGGDHPADAQKNGGRCL